MRDNDPLWSINASKSETKIHIGMSRRTLLRENDIGVINALKDQHYSASLEFSRLVLENALIVWRRGAHYRSMSQYHNIEMATGKGKMISAYLYYLAEGIKSVYGTVPVEIEGLLGDVVNKSIHDIGQKVISEMKDTL